LKRSFADRKKRAEILNREHQAVKSPDTITTAAANQHGFVGAPLPTVIESFGSTSLVEVGENYFLDSISSGTGPELQYQGRTGLQVVISCRKTPTLLDLIEESIDQVARAIRLRAEAD
jgi:hypothetical protein